MSELPHVTAILEATGLTDFSAVPDDVLELAQWRGSAVHRACQYLDEGTLDWGTVQPEHVGYVRAWESWKAAAGFIVDEIEIPVQSLTSGYVGTQDRIGHWARDTFHSGPIDLDLKTGSIQPSAALQLAAYTMCHFQPFHRMRLAVRLLKDGDYRTRVYPVIEPHHRHELGHGLLKDFNTFEAALRLWKWKQENM